MVTFEGDPYVLVGYDGSAEAGGALRWGVQEARLRRRPLTICHSWHMPYPWQPSHEDADAVAVIRRMAEHTLDRGVHIARAQAPALTVRKRLVTGPPAACLLEGVSEAELIVVGSQGSGGYPGPAGSTARQVAAYAHCPVVVFRESSPALRRVVIGVDGSAAGDSALAFGFEEAALRGWEVEAVYGAWELQAIAGSESALYADIDTLKREGGTRLERAVAPWREKYPRVPVSTSLTMSEPRLALLQAADQAVLLVVGDRGEGGLPGMRLGAVSEAMLQQAPCTVAVTHPRHRK